MNLQLLKMRQLINSQEVYDNLYLVVVKDILNNSNPAKAFQDNLEVLELAETQYAELHNAFINKNYKRLYDRLNNWVERLAETKIADGMDRRHKDVYIRNMLEHLNSANQ